MVWPVKRAGWKHTPESIEKMRGIQRNRTWKVGRLSAMWTDGDREQARQKQTGKRHTLASRQKMSEAKAGGKDISSLNRQAMIEGMRTPAARKRRSEAHKRHAALDLSGCGCYAHKPRSPTTIEHILVDMVLAEFPEVITQKYFSYYHVDAYLPPPYHLAFEADGAYWHQDQTADHRRDQELLKRFGLPVVRLSEQELLEMAHGPR